MHGPFLFHYRADLRPVRRLRCLQPVLPALFGVILVALPILLRGPRHLGRWGALTASALILISPSLLYQSRYLRHDIFTVVGSPPPLNCHRTLRRAAISRLVDRHRGHGRLSAHQSRDSFRYRRHLRSRHCRGTALGQPAATGAGPGRRRRRGRRAGRLPAGCDRPSVAGDPWSHPTQTSNSPSTGNC